MYIINSNQLGVVLGWKGDVPMKVKLLDSSFVGVGKVRDQIYQNTYNSLKCLVDGSYYTQHLLTELTCLSSLDYWKQFCTIRFCSARQSGNTTAICKIAKDYFTKVIFLSPSYDMSHCVRDTFYRIYGKKDVTELLSDKLLTKNDGYFFGSYGSLDVFRGIACEAVVIDPSFMLNPKQEDEIFRTLGPCMSQHPEKFFIFIG